MTTDDPDLTLLTWFFAVGYFFGQHELAEQLRAVEGKLDKLGRELEARLDRAIEGAREGRDFTPPSMQ